MLLECQLRECSKCQRKQIHFVCFVKKKKKTEKILPALLEKCQNILMIRKCNQLSMNEAKVPIEINYIEICVKLILLSLKFI